jgi:flagellar basal-body rod protein FlgC
MSIFNLLSVSASAMAAQRARAETIVENLANAETTRTPEGGPYRRKTVVLQAEAQGSAFARELAGVNGPQGVRVAEVVEDGREPELRFLPGHPDADANGYVAFPSGSVAEDMVELMNASRSHQANVAAMAAVKDMIQKSIDLIR